MVHLHNNAKAKKRSGAKGVAMLPEHLRDFVATDTSGRPHHLLKITNMDVEHLYEVKGQIGEKFAVRIRCQNGNGQWMATVKRGGRVIPKMTQVIDGWDNVARWLLKLEPETLEQMPLN